MMSILYGNSKVRVFNEAQNSDNLVFINYQLNLVKHMSQDRGGAAIKKVIQESKVTLFKSYLKLVQL